MRRTNLLFTILFSILLISGCNLPLSPPVSTPSVVPTTPPAPPPSPSPEAILPSARPPAITPENTSNMKQTGAIPIENPYRLFFSLDGLHLTISSGQQAVRISTLTGEIENSLPVTESGVLLALSPYGDLAAVSSDHTVINLVSLENNKTIGSIRPQGNFSDAFFTVRTPTLGVVSVDDIRVDLYGPATGSLERSFSGFQTAAPVYNVFPTPDGRSLAWISRARLQLMDIDTGQFGPEFTHEDFIAGWALSPDGGTLVTSAGGEVDGQFFPLLFFWDTRSGNQTGVLKLTEAPAACIAFSPDGQLLAAAVGKTVQLYRVSDRTLLTTLEDPGDNLSYLAFSPDGASLAASAQDNLVHLWQVVP